MTPIKVLTNLQYLVFFQPSLILASKLSSPWSSYLWFGLMCSMRECLDNIKQLQVLGLRLQLIIFRSGMPPSESHSYSRTISKQSKG